MTECVPCRQHMSVMREWHRERKVNSTRELAYHSPITIYRVQTAYSETGSLACSGWMVPNHLTIFQPLCPAAVTTSVVSFTPTSSPLPPHLLWQCWLPHYSHNPLPFDYTGSNHTTPTGVWENHMFDVRKWKTCSKASSHICVISGYRWGERTVWM